ncbi:MAG TPA: hypothetical protein VGL48_13845 [Acidimicrobiales bacterium]
MRTSSGLFHRGEFLGLSKQAGLCFDLALPGLLPDLGSLAAVPQAHQLARWDYPAALDAGSLAGRRASLAHGVLRLLAGVMESNSRL